MKSKTSRLGNTILKLLDDKENWILRTNGMIKVLQCEKAGFAMRIDSIEAFNEQCPYFTPADSAAIWLKTQVVRTQIEEARALRSYRNNTKYYQTLRTKLFRDIHKRILGV